MRIFAVGTKNIWGGPGQHLGGPVPPRPQRRTAPVHDDALYKSTYLLFLMLVCMYTKPTVSSFSTCIHSRVTTLHTMWNSLTIPGNFTMSFPRRFSALLPMLCVTRIMLVLVFVNGGGRNATVHDTKPKCTNSAKSRMDANMQLTVNSFRSLLPDKIFSRTFPYKWSPCHSQWRIQ